MSQTKWQVTLFVPLALLSLCLWNALPVHAQTAASSAQPFSVKIGTLSVADGNTRRFSGKSHLTLGATYEPGSAGKTGAFRYGAYLDYLWEGSRTLQDGPFTTFDNLTSYTFDVRVRGRTSGGGAGLSGRYLLGSNPAASVVPYLGGGVGVYFLRAHYSADAVNVKQEGGYPLYDLIRVQSASNNTTGLGGKLFAGVETRSGFLGEVEYQFLPKFRLNAPDDSGDYTDVKMGGFGVRVGYRF